MNRGEKGRTIVRVSPVFFPPVCQSSHQRERSYEFPRAFSLPFSPLRKQENEETAGSRKALSPAVSGQRREGSVGHSWLVVVVDSDHQCPFPSFPAGGPAEMTELKAVAASRIWRPPPPFFFFFFSLSTPGSGETAAERGQPKRPSPPFFFPPRTRRRWLKK